MIEYIDKFLQGDCRDILKQIPLGTFNCAITSPPYWSLRDNHTMPVIFDGDPHCEHDFEGDNSYHDNLRFRPGDTTSLGNFINPEIYNTLRRSGGRDGGFSEYHRKHDITEIKVARHTEGETNPGKEAWYKDKGGITTSGGWFCSKCGAWKGQLGLEPDYKSYVSHLCDIFDSVYRVLAKEGTLWVNIGDTHSGSGNGSNDHRDAKNKNFANADHYNAKYGGVKSGKTSKPNKSLMLIPFHFAIEMENRGWVLRNTIIWKKPNAMPASARDRFTIDYEYVFYFAKNNKTMLWKNLKTGKWKWTKPDYFGIVDVDWRWDKCPRCLKKPNKTCKKCNGTGLVKRTYWLGYSNYFEQQFEPIKLESVERNRRGKNNGKWQNKDAPKEFQQTFHQARDNKGYEGVEDEFENHQGRNKRTVWEISTKGIRQLHFSSFPVELVRQCFEAGCPEGGLILDPFMGSGTVALSSKLYDRHFTGCELNPKYIKMAKDRLKSLDTEKAKLNKKGIHE